MAFSLRAGSIHKQIMNMMWAGIGRVRGWGDEGRGGRRGAPGWGGVGWESVRTATRLQKPRDGVRGSYDALTTRADTSTGAPLYV